MSSNQDPTASPLSVCNQCKKRKKKCDKLLPTCSRCKRLGVHCLYVSDVKDGPDCSTERGMSERGNSLALHHHIGTTSSTVPLSETVSPFAFITLLARSSEELWLSGGELRSLDLDEKVTVQACKLMMRDGDDITPVCERFFKVTEKWLPIIDREEFFIRLGHLQTSPNAAFSTLVMSMCLNAYQSSPALGRNSSVESLYLTVKCLCSLLQSNGRVSLDLLRAGLLIATYEYCQALYEASTLSIGICARMGYSMGLHRTIQSGAWLEQIPPRELEERRRVWWGLFILERIMAIEHFESGIPFACKTPSKDQRLPSDSIRTDQDRVVLYPSDVYTPVSFELRNGTPTRLGPYPREAQAAYLMSRVQDLIIDDSLKEEERQWQAEELDNSLQSLLMAMLEPPSGYSRGDYCGAYSICISALMCLHQSRLSKESWSDPASDSASRSLLALETVSSMLLEATASSLVGPPLDWDTLPIWSITSLYVASLVRVKLGSGFPDKKQGKLELGPARAYLKHFEARYQIAADHLDRVDKALASHSGQIQPASL